MTLTTSLPITLTTSNTNISWPSTAPIYINVPPGWTTNTFPGTYSYYPVTADPNSSWLTPEVLESLFQKMVTTVKPGEKAIVCVDLDLTAEQCLEVKEGMNNTGIDGIVMRGARAGTGFAGNTQNMTREETRVDILARLLELWQQRPELKLTSLLEWYHGEEMEDAEFAAAAEVYFEKVTNGILQRP